ncbi:MAG: FG-GAP repeat domain-containing protein, partial [Acidobacteriota bacterium]
MLLLYKRICHRRSAGVTPAGHDPQLYLHLPENLPGNQELKTDSPGGREVRATLLSQSVVWLRPKAAMCLSAIALLAAAPPAIEFVDRAPAAKLNVITYNGGPEKNHILESTGTGLLLLDYDGDFDQDIYFVNAFTFPKRGETKPHSNVLYRNDGNGTFTDVTAASGTGAAVYGQGGCVGDIDNDGFPDMYITNFGPNILYRNNGNGTFSDISAQAKIGDPRWSIGCTFFDADKDGDHDLYVANYIEATWQEVHAARRTRLWRGKVEVLDGPKGLPGSPDSFYLNNGNGTFTEATERAGLKPGTEHYSMGVISFDYDNDGDIDLYVANDSTPNCLYRNRG